MWNFWLHHIYKMCFLIISFWSLGGGAAAIAQLVKKFTELNGIRKFIIMFIRAHHLFVSQATLILAHGLPFCLRFIYVQVFHVVPSVRFFPAKTSYALFSHHMCHMLHPLHPPWFDHPNNSRRAHVIKFFLMLDSPVYWYFLPLRCSTLCMNTVQLHDSKVICTMMARLAMWWSQDIRCLSVICLLASWFKGPVLKCVL